MPRPPSAFKQADIAKAVKAVRSAGVDILRVEVDPNGKVVIVTATEAEQREDNSWDRV